MAARSFVVPRHHSIRLTCQGPGADVSMLMFAAVPPATPLWGLSAKTLALKVVSGRSIVATALWFTLGAGLAWVDFPVGRGGLGLTPQPKRAPASAKCPPRCSTGSGQEDSTETGGRRPRVQAASPRYRGRPTGPVPLRRGACRCR